MSPPSVTILRGSSGDPQSAPTDLVEGGAGGSKDREAGTVFRWLSLKRLYVQCAAQAPSADTMHEPMGVSGVHTVPKSLQSVGFLTPRSTANSDKDDVIN